MMAHCLDDNEAWVAAAQPLLSLARLITARQLRNDGMAWFAAARCGYRHGCGTDMTGRHHRRRPDVPGANRP